MNDIDDRIDSEYDDDRQPGLPRCPECGSSNVDDVAGDEDSTKWECLDCGYSWWEDEE